MVGLFINTLPVRVRMDPRERILPWLQVLQAHQMQMQEYEYSPLVSVQSWSDMPRGTPLFESLVLFESFPFEKPPRSDKNSRQQKKGRTGSVQHGSPETNYPLTLLTVQKREELTLLLSYSTSRFESASARRLLSQLQSILLAIAVNPEQRLRDLQIMSEAERLRVLTGFHGGMRREEVISFRKLARLAASL